MNISDRREKLFAMFDRGIVTGSETCNGFVALILNADDDAAALALCDRLPDRFRTTFRTWLAELANRDYAYRRFLIGDTRTPEQVEADAKRDQEILSRLGPTVLGLL